MTSESEETRARHPERDEAGEADGSVTLGLLPAPEMPERIASDLADELPELLRRHIDEKVRWNVPVVSDPLTGDWRDAPEILDETYERSRREGWDYAICLTDLPVNRGGRLVVADASRKRRVGEISLPALGVTLLRRRVREAILQLASEMYWGSSESERNREEKSEEADGDENEGASDEANTGEENLRGRGSRQLIGRRLTERLAPIKRITPNDEEMDVDVRFVAPRVSGYARLLAGMVLANRPWRLFTVMKGAMAAAFATGAYVLVTPTIWQLGYAGGPLRVFALMVTAVLAMVVWFIASHDLWERSSDVESRYLARLYNAATALTLAAAVLFAYAVLYVFVLLAALIFIDPGFLQSNIRPITEQPIGPGDYVFLAWITSSLAVVAGSLGSGLEDEETVRDATYGYRQRRRSREVENGSDQ